MISPNEVGSHVFEIATQGRLLRPFENITDSDVEDAIDDLNIVDASDDENDIDIEI